MILSGVSSVSSSIRLASVTLASFVALSLVCIFAVNVMPASAQISINIDDDTRLSVRSGNFDVTRYSGRMFDVSLYEDDRLILTADELVMESSGALNDQDFFIDNFYLRNGIIVGEQLRFAEVTVENVNIAEFIHAIEKREETGGPLLATGAGLSNESRLQIKGIKIVADGILAKVKNVETLGLSFDQLPDGQRFFKDFGFVVDGFRMTPIKISSDTEELKRVLDARGLDALTIDMAISQAVTPIVDGLGVENMINLELHDLASMQMLANIDLTFAALATLNQIEHTDFSSLEQATPILEGLRLRAFTGTYYDLGMLDALVAVTAEDEQMQSADVRTSMRLAISQGLQAFLPRNGMDLARPIETLIQQGGGLELEVKPTQPVPLASFVGFMFMPDLAIDQLGVGLTHLRSQ